MTAIGISAVFSLITLFFLHQVYRWYQFVKKINAMPGFPGTLSGFGIRSTISLYRAFASTHQEKISERLYQYSTSHLLLFPKGIMKLWVGHVPVVMIMKPDLVQQLLGNNKNEIRKGMFYKLIRPFMGNGLLTNSGEEWRMHRKLLTPAFHFNILDHSLRVMHKNCDILIQKLKSQMEQSKDGIIDDIAKPILNCMLDNVIESALGQEMHAQDEAGQAAHIVRYIERIFSGIIRRGLSPWLYPDLLFNLSSAGISANQDLRKVREIINTAVEEKKKELAEKSLGTEGTATSEHNENKYSSGKSNVKSGGFLDCLISLQRESPSELSQDDLRNQFMTFIAAGYETTGWATSWAVHQLSLDMESQERLHDEVDQELPDKNATLTQDFLKKDLKFTEAIFYEAMRLHPVPFISRQLDHDIVIDGYTIPAQTTVGINLMTLHRDPDHWDQPNRFIPDRFYQNTRTNHPFAFIPFSAGARNCIGQKYATMSAKLMLAKIFRHFRVTAVDPGKEVGAQVLLVQAAGDDIRVKLEARD